MSLGQILGFSPCILFLGLPSVPGAGAGAKAQSFSVHFGPTEVGP